MQKRSVWLVLLLAALTSVVRAQDVQKPAPPLAPKTNLRVGQLAPDFSLPDTTGKIIKLSEFRGKKNVVLAFYVLAFTGG